MTLVVGHAPHRKDRSAISLAAMMARSMDTDLIVVSVVPAPWPTPVAANTDKEFVAWARREGATGVAEAENVLRRALSVNPNSVTAAYNLSLLAYREKRLDEARALIRRVMQLPNPGSEALFLGMCIERKLGDRPSEASYVSQLRNRYPDSAEARAIPPGACE